MVKCLSKGEGPETDTAVPGPFEADERALARQQRVLVDQLLGEGVVVAHRRAQIRREQPFKEARAGDFVSASALALREAGLQVAVEAAGGRLIVYLHNPRDVPIKVPGSTIELLITQL